MTDRPSDGLVALVLDDAGLLLAGPDGPRLPRSPGVALLDGDEILTGAEAAAQRRRSPRRVHDRFWQELATTPLGPPFPAGLAAADLAYRQLAALWSAGSLPGERLLIAAPGATSVRQLGVLLGVARAVEVPVAGLVDLGVALAAAHSAAHSATRPGGAGRLLHLEVYQHRAVATELTAGEAIVRRSVAVAEGGWAGLEDAWVRYLSQAFLRRVRFDPQHDANTEQELYDRLPTWLAAVAADGRASVRLGGTGEGVGIEVDEAEIVAVVDPSYARILDLASPGGSGAGGSGPGGSGWGGSRLLLGSRAATLPGLLRRLGRSVGDREIEVLADPAPAEATLEAGPAILAASEGGRLPFVTRLTLASREPPRPTPVAPPTTRRRVARHPHPTHVVVRGIAHRVPPAGRLVLGGRPPSGSPGVVLPAAAGVAEHHVTLSRLDDGGVELTAHGETLFDGAPVVSRRLVPGERLRLGSPGIEVELIALAEEE